MGVLTVTYADFVLSRYVKRTCEATWVLVLRLVGKVRRKDRWEGAIAGTLSAWYFCVLLHVVERLVVQLPHLGGGRCRRMMH